MKKKYLLIGLLSALSTMASAETNNAFTGWFASAALNASMVTGNVDNHVDYYNPNGSNQYNSYNATQAQTNAKLGLYADFGYSFIWNDHYYLGLSGLLILQPQTQTSQSAFSYVVNGSDASPTVIHHGNGFTSSNDSNLSYGIKLMPGLLLNDNSLAYINLAITSQSYRNTINSSYYTTPGFQPTVPQAYAGDTVSTNQLYTYSVGLGYEKIWRAHWSVFAELNYESPLKYNTSRTVVDPDTNLTRTESYDVTYSGFDANLGLRYRF
jgi:hypothetical protein